MPFAGSYSRLTTTNKRFRILYLLVGYFHPSCQMRLLCQRQVPISAADSILTDVYKIHGLMTDHFFPESMRKQVLREIAGRTQKTVFDVVYSWYVNVH
jgi:hypothetical protein